MNLFLYQKRAVNRIVDELSMFIDEGYSAVNRVQFKSPTGSGKTIMTYNAMMDFSRKTGEQVAWVWIAPNKLQDQSHDKFSDYNDMYSNDFIVQTPDEVGDIMEDNTVLFVNWNSIRNEKNKFIIASENRTNLSGLIKNTQDAGIRIIVVIDESHHTLKTYTSKTVIDIIKPDALIEVSATLKESNEANLVRVRRDEVYNAGVIRDIQVNPGINKDYLDSISGDAKMNDWILDLALDYQNKLREEYQDVKPGHLPLMLVQIPSNKNDDSGEEINLLDSYEKMLNDRGISVDNGKLAIWLSGKKTKNVDDIDNNKVEVLIFKQAVAMGWDCPRAQILTLFRENKGTDFTIQLLGRILRVASIKDLHYDNFMLDTGVVFTTHSLNYTDQEAQDNITKRVAIKRNDSLYSDSFPSLVNNRLKRNSGKFDPKITTLGPMIRGCFNSIIAGIDLTTGIKTGEAAIPKERTLGDVDNISDRDETQQVKSANADDVSATLFNFTRENMIRYGDSKRHCNLVKDTIISLLKKEVAVEVYNENSTALPNIIMNSNINRRAKSNRQEFAQLIKDVDEKNFKKYGKAPDSIPVEDEPDFTIPEKISSPIGSIEYKYHAKKYIMKPAYIKLDNELEREFAKMLTNSPKVKWWYKNGEKARGESFGIPYTNAKKTVSLFYPDFIVMLTDGTLFIGDTKADYTDDERKLAGVDTYLSKHRNTPGACSLEMGFIMNSKTSDYSSGDWTLKLSETNIVPIKNII